MYFFPLRRCPGPGGLISQEKDGLPVAFENKPNYVRMLTIFGNARVSTHAVEQQF